MKVAVVAIALNEERFIGPWLQHIPDWVLTKCVLVSEKPWFGDENVFRDDTYEVAETNGAMVIKRPWASEHEQRNFGQDLFGDYDWVIVLDPDEFLDDDNWAKLKELIDSAPQNDAFVVDHQLTYWKDGWVADPPKDYQQLILVRPGIRFVDKDFDTVKWFNDVWKTWEPGVQDVHPTTPDTLHDFIRAELPPELERLNLWPQK